MSLRTCENGHKYEKTSDCPVCPICSSNEMKSKYEHVLPKISAPALRALASIKVETLKDVSKYTESELLELHGFGPKAIRILKAALKEKGLKFKDEG